MQFLRRCLENLATDIVESNPQVALRALGGAFSDTDEE